ncbi:MAG: aspartyl protease family protein [Proteobacteria bacterium]|nr:aspartyl protease family protein [Pseudomonadota bacterium]
MKHRFHHSLRRKLGLSLLLGCCAWPAFAGPISQNPAEILAQMKAASGGSRWNEIRSLHTVTAVRNGGEDERREQWEDVRTGRYMLRVSGPHSVRQTGFDGVTPWIQGRSGIAYTFGDTDALLAAADEAFQISRAWWFPERVPATIAAVGSKRIGDSVYDILSITPAGGRPFQAWIDHRTHLLARTVEQQAEAELVTTFSDYRMVDGVNLPFNIGHGDGGDQSPEIVEHVQSVDINLQISDRLYAVPPRPTSDVEFPAGSDRVEIPFRIASNNRILVPVTVDGLRLEAWFDSGGSLFLQPDTIAKLNAKTHGRYRFSGGGEGTVVTGIGSIGAIALGGAKVRGLSFHGFPFYPPDPDEGLIGLEILQRFVVHIDFDRNVMTLTRPQAFRYDGKGVVVPFHLQDNQPEVIGSIDGIAGRFAIDTGDTGSLLLIAPFARRYGLKQRYLADIPYDGRSVGVTKGVWARKRVHSVAFNGPDGRPVAEVRDPVTRISLQHSGFDADRYVAANVGLGILRKFNLTFDYMRRRIILEPNRSYGQRDIYNRTGFRLSRSGNGWKITTLFAPSPAAEAGLQEEDVIETIDGKSPRDLEEAQLSDLLKGPVGTRLRLVVDRAGKRRRCVITLRDVF